MKAYKMYRMFNSLNFILKTVNIPCWSRNSSIGIVTVLRGGLQESKRDSIPGEAVVLLFPKHVMCPCHHGMAGTLVADGGYVLQTWRDAASVFNEQSRITDKGWFSS
jgi:hypothetical protein